MTGKRQSEALAKPYGKNLVALADHNAGSLPLCGSECLSVLRFLRPFRHCPAWCRLIDLFCRLCLTFHPIFHLPLTLISHQTSTLLFLPITIHRNRVSSIKILYPVLYVDTLPSHSRGFLLVPSALSGRVCIRTSVPSIKASSVS